ncbi:MAG: sulfatase [Acidobacteria bacterium]|nr:sulfatase [Acidobacteriota bacterium]
MTTTSFSRRTFLAASAASLFAAPAKPRNVLFIGSDDLNHCFSTYGHPVVRTPNLDRIASRGVRFDRSYCQFPLCSPSRTSFLTGLAPDATTVYDLKKHFRETVPDVVTLPQAFQKNGYFAARVGKMYHYGNPGDIGTNGLDDERSWNKRINPKGIDKEEEPKLINYTPGRGIGSALCYYASPGRDEQHTDGMVAAEAIALMEQNGNRPWFVAPGFYKPHCPYIAPSKYFDMVPMDRVKLVPFEEWEMQIAPKWAYFTLPPHWGLNEKQRLEVMRAYYASILFMDANVGKLLDAVKRLGQEDNTTIFFWSDHGYQLGEHGQWMKQTVFEPAARSPLIIAGAGVKARGKGCARTVEFLDIYPTAVALAGLKDVPGHLHGTSLVPLLDNPNRAWDRPAVTQVRRQQVMGYSLRTERYRYSMWKEGAEGEELYDYSKDPRELKNLAKDAGSAALKAQLRARLDGIVAKRRKT